MPVTRLKIAGLCGVLAPVIAFSSISIAIFLSPWFNWVTNALSDLGANGIAATIFNFGLILSGLLGIVFAFEMAKVLSGGVLRFFGGLVFFLGALAVVGVGAFPVTAGNIHLYVSVALFVLFPISFLIIGASMMTSKSRINWGRVSIIAAVLAALPWIFPWQGVAIPETISASVVSVWAIFMGLKMFRGSM